MARLAFNNLHQRIVDARYTPLDPNDEYICYGQCDCGQCDAKMMYIQRNDKTYGYFRVDTSINRHRLGCEYDMSSKAHIVRCLDRSLNTLDFDKLLNDMVVDRDLRCTKTKGLKHQDCYTDDSIDDYIDTRNFKQQLRPPKNITEMYYLFDQIVRQPFVSAKTQRIINNHFLNKNNVDQIRSDPKLIDGKKVLMMCRKSQDYKTIGR